MENYILSDPTFLDEENKYFKHKMSYIKSQLKKIWFASHKVENIFQKNNYNWQQSTIEIPCSKTGVDRPSKSFMELSERNKRRKTQQLRKHLQHRINL